MNRENIWNLVEYCKQLEYNKLSNREEIEVLKKMDKIINQRIKEMKGNVYKNITYSDLLRKCIDDIVNRYFYSNNEQYLCESDTIYKKIRSEVVKHVGMKGNTCTADEYVEALKYLHDIKGYAIDTTFYNLAGINIDF